MQTGKRRFRSKGRIYQEMGKNVHEIAHELSFRLAKSSSVINLVFQFKEKLTTRLNHHYFSSFSKLQVCGTVVLGTV